jgi:hypothetical protein
MSVLGANAWEFSLTLGRSLRRHDVIRAKFPSTLTLATDNTAECWSLPTWDSTNDEYMVNRVQGVTDGVLFTDRNGVKVDLNGDPTLKYKLDCEVDGQYIYVFGLNVDLDLRMNTDTDSSYSKVRILFGDTVSKNPVTNPYYAVSTLGAAKFKTYRFTYDNGPRQYLEYKHDVTSDVDAVTMKTTGLTGDKCAFKNVGTVLKGLTSLMGSNKNTVPENTVILTTYEIGLDGSFPL